ncbi:unnamed protein product [Ectocarpus sp. 6 AP-2014]
MDASSSTPNRAREGRGQGRRRHGDTYPKTPHSRGRRLPDGGCHRRRRCCCRRTPQRLGATGHQDRYHEPNTPEQEGAQRFHRRAGRRKRGES